MGGSRYSKNTVLLFGLMLMSVSSVVGETESLIIDDSYDAPSRITFEPFLIQEPNIQDPRLKLGFETELRHESNIFLLSPGQEVEANSYSFSPHILYRVLGDALTDHLLVVGYGSTFTYDDASRDTRVNHDADLVYRYQTGRTVVTLSGDYRHIEGYGGFNLATVGDSLLLREQRNAISDLYHTRLEIDYQISSLLDAEFDADFERGSYDTLNDRNSHGAEFALMYGGSDAITRLGPYVGYRMHDAESNLDQEAIQAGGRIDWRYSAVTHFYGQIGVDDRSFQGVGAAGDRSEVVWAAGMRWNPGPGLSGELSLRRHVEPSISSDAVNFTLTTVTAGIRKEFCHDYFVRLAGSFSRAEYESNLRGVTLPREDEYYLASVGIGRKLADYGELSVFYHFLENDSTLAAFGFENSTVGMSLSVDF